MTLVCFGIDASHGYEHIHRSALDALAKLESLYMLSEPTFKRDTKPLGPLTGFPVLPDWDEEKTRNGRAPLCPGRRGCCAP